MLPGVPSLALKEYTWSVSRFARLAYYGHVTSWTKGGSLISAVCSLSALAWCPSKDPLTWANPYGWGTSPSLSARQPMPTTAQTLRRISRNIPSQKPPPSSGGFPSSERERSYGATTTGSKERERLYGATSLKGSKRSPYLFLVTFVFPQMEPALVSVPKPRYWMISV